ncbi:tRNA(Ile)-lysidine synthetase, partial [Klebsiella pneumoniae]
PLLFYGETPIAAADDLFVTTEGEVKDGEGVRLCLLYTSRCV